MKAALILVAFGSADETDDYLHHTVNKRNGDEGAQKDNGGVHGQNLRFRVRFDQNDTNKHSSLQEFQTTPCAGAGRPRINAGFD